MKLVLINLLTLGVVVTPAVLIDVMKTRSPWVQRHNYWLILVLYTAILLFIYAWS